MWKWKPGRGDLENLPDAGETSAAPFMAGRFSPGLLVNFIGENVFTVGKISAEPSYKPDIVSILFHMKDDGFFSLIVYGSMDSVRY